MFLKQPALWISLGTIIFLTACGSSNNNPPTTPPNNPPPDESNNVTLSGVATKGLLKGAKVTAYELDSAGSRLPDDVGTTETDANGEYELQLSDAYAGGLIEVEVSVIEGTKMICDASQCGSVGASEEMDLPADFTLSAFVEKPDGSDTISASVTAWSTMAAKRAKAILAADPSKSLKDAATQANSEVSQVVGFDIAATESKGLSQIADAAGAQAQYAVMNAAVAEILFQGSDGSDFTERLNSFTSSLDDGILGGGDDSVKLADFANAVRQVAESVELDDTASEAISNQTAQFDAAGDEGFAPEYDEDLVVDKGATQEEKIAAFQSFVAGARTWVSQVEQLDGDALGLAVDVDVQTVQTILSSNTQGQFTFLGLALDQVSGFLTENAASVQGYIDNGVEQDIPVLDELGADIGTATLTFADVNGLLQVSVNGALTGESSNTYLPFSLVLNTGIAPEVLTATAVTDVDGTHLTLDVAKLLASNTMTLSGHVSDGQGGKPVTLNVVSVNLELDQALEADTILAEHINSHFKSATLAGDVTIVSEGASFTGNVELQLVKLLSGFAILGEEITPIAFKYFGVSGDFTMDGGSHSFSAAASLDVKNAANFDTFAWSDYSGAEDDVFAETDNALVETLIGVDLETTYDYWLNVSGDFSAGPETLMINSDYSFSENEWDFTPERTATQAEYDAIETAVRAVILDEYGSTELAEALTIGWINVGGDKWHGAWIWAEIGFPDLETAENFMQVALTLSAKVNIPELQAAQVTTTVNRSSYRGGSVRVNVKWNGGSYTVLVSSSDFETGEAVSVRLFNTQGYELSLNLTFASEADGGGLADMTGNALLNGENIGTVEFREGTPVIVYPNGDEEIFESLY